VQVEVIVATAVNVSGPAGQDWASVFVSVQVAPDCWVNCCCRCLAAAIAFASAPVAVVSVPLPANDTVVVKGGGGAGWEADWPAGVLSAVVLAVATPAVMAAGIAAAMAAASTISLIFTWSSWDWLLHYGHTAVGVARAGNDRDLTTNISASCRTRKKFCAIKATYCAAAGCPHRS
jgi:hypothetical protein